MSVCSLIAECEASGVSVFLSDTGKVKLSGNADAVKAAADRLRQHKDAILNYLKYAQTETLILLERFRLDLCEREPEPELIGRINNICFRLVTANCWPFEDAMRAAAVWVVHNPEHPDERHFTDVLALYRGVEGAIKATPTQTLHLDIEVLRDMKAASALQCRAQPRPHINDDDDLVSF